jgi:hypothetical protein
MKNVTDTDEPSYIDSDGTLWYWVDYILHRTNGPAVILADGTPDAYYVDGIEYTQDEYPQAVLKYKLKQLVG